jgi:hypothetical protein
VSVDKPKLVVIKSSRSVQGEQSIVELTGVFNSVLQASDRLPVWPETPKISSGLPPGFWPHIMRLCPGCPGFCCKSFLKSCNRIRAAPICADFARKRVFKAMFCYFCAGCKPKSSRGYAPDLTLSQQVFVRFGRTRFHPSLREICQKPKSLRIRSFLKNAGLQAEHEKACLSRTPSTYKEHSTKPSVADINANL